MNGDFKTNNALSENTKPNNHICPGCGSQEISIFHEVNDIPVHSVLNIPTREKALNYPRGEIVLGFCGECGFIFNMAFHPELLEYSSECEESQGCSPTYTAYANQIAKYLIEKYNLYNKDILEIGCGKGEFLSLLCEIGDNRGIGIDPAYVEGRIQNLTGNQITFIKDYYSEKHTHYHGDLVCCKMTLEHIPDTGDFVSMVRRTIGDRMDTVVFFQVPDVIRILKDCAFEDIYYEHCSYFCPGSLMHLFQKCGFNVLDLKTAYNDQYLLLEAKPVSEDLRQVSPLETNLEEITTYVDKFKKKYTNMVAYWQSQLQKIKAEMQRAVVWGSGSKGVAFLTKLGIYDEIEFVVDINPNRQGTHMAGTGQPIVSPDFLCEYKPDIVIVMNSIYRDEIKEELARMNLKPEILTLGMKGS